MTEALLAWLAAWSATNTPALPTGTAMHLWLRIGWSVLLAWAGVAGLGRALRKSAWHPRWRWAGALLLALWVWLPESYSAAYWLGLAFQMPSLVSVLLCMLLLVDAMVSERRTGADQMPVASGDSRLLLTLAVLGTMLGWALLLDTFALLPAQLYSFGFSPAATGLALLVVLLPWIISGNSASGCVGRLGLWVAPAAVVAFGLWRLPTGNVWDAMLDPWLWVGLQVYAVKAFWIRYKNSS